MPFLHRTGIDLANNYKSLKCSVAKYGYRSHSRPHMVYIQHSTLTGSNPEMCLEKTTLIYGHYIDKLFPGVCFFLDAFPGWARTHLRIWI
jgi:hypothetical protein